MLGTNPVELNEWYTISTHLVGVAVGHKRIPSNRIVFTTRLRHYDVERDVFVTESGTSYRLGEQHAISKRVYPNLKDQLKVRLSETEGQEDKVEETVPLQ